MRLIFTIIFIVSLNYTFAHHRINLGDFNYDDFGYIIKSSGDTVYGSFSLNNVFNSSKITLKITEEQQLKIPAKEITYVVSGNYILRNFNNFRFLGRIIDTNNNVKIYESYSIEWRGVVGHSGQQELLYSYIILPPNSAFEVIYEEPSNIRKINNYKEELQQLFSYNKGILTYLTSLGKIPFDDIPKIVAKINTLFK